MAKESSLGIFLFVSELVVIALLPVFHFSIESLQNLTILLFTVTNAIDFFTQLCGMLSNAFWSSIQAVLKFLFFSCNSHILPLVSLIDPCNLCFQGDILFTLLVISSALPNVWRFFQLIFVLGFCTWSLSM